MTYRCADLMEASNDARVSVPVWFMLEQMGRRSSRSKQCFLGNFVFMANPRSRICNAADLQYNGVKYFFPHSASWGRFSHDLVIDCPGADADTLEFVLPAQVMPLGGHLLWVHTSPLAKR